MQQSTPPPPSTYQENETRETKRTTKTQIKSIATATWDFITWTPPSCRYDPDNPRVLTLPLNLLFGAACTFTVANLYYSHPLLDLLAQEFNVSQERAAIIPTAAQAGYAGGILFLCPMGDLVRRRPFVLSLMLFTATVSLGVCITKRYEVFVAVTFLMSVTTVTPQIMLPLVGDLAKPNRRATALSIVVSGLLLGLLIARLLSGIIAAYTSSWRNVYWMSLALQYAILALLWLWMPDYPATNSDLTYPDILWTMARLAVTEPVLVQSCLMQFFFSATFTSFWTTLTFLLSGDPYNYSTIIIGLFALAGLGPMIFGPPFARVFIDRFHTQLSVLVGAVLNMVGIAVGTFVGTRSVAGPIVQALLFDFGLQVTQIANRAAIYGAVPKASSRVNTVYMLAAFAGQLMGTAVGNRLYARGGWVLSGSCNLGFTAAAIVLLALRGPYESEKRWIGWRGGIGVRRVKKPSCQEEQNERGELVEDDREKIKQESS